MLYKNRAQKYYVFFLLANIMLFFPQKNVNFLVLCYISCQNEPKIAQSIDPLQADVGVVDCLGLEERNHLSFKSSSNSSANMAGGDGFVTSG